MKAPEPEAEEATASGGFEVKKQEMDGNGI